MYSVKLKDAQLHRELYLMLKKQNDKNVMYTFRNIVFIFRGSTSPGGLGPLHEMDFTNTKRRTTPGRTPLEE